MKKRTSAKKRKPRRKIDTKDVREALSGLEQLTRRALAEGEAMNPEDHVDDLRVAVHQLQDAVPGFKREVKRRMIEDKRLKPRKGEHFIAYVKLKAGKPKSSKDPDDYDLIAERIQ